MAGQIVTAVHHYGVEPVGGGSVRIMTADLNAGNPAQLAIVKTAVVDMPIDHPSDTLQLREPDRSRDIVHVILIAHLANVDLNARLRPIDTEPAHTSAGGQILGVLTDQHAAIDGRHVFDCLEGKHRVLGVVADVFALV